MKKFNNRKFMINTNIYYYQRGFHLGYKHDKLYWSVAELISKSTCSDTVNGTVLLKSSAFNLSEILFIFLIKLCCTSFSFSRHLFIQSSITTEPEITSFPDRFSKESPFETGSLINISKIEITASLCL